jgi:hypothetical protein
MSDDDDDDENFEGRFLKEELERRMRMEEEAREYERYLYIKRSQQRRLYAMALATVALTATVSFYFYYRDLDTPISRILLLAVPLAAVAVSMLTYLQSPAILRTRTTSDTSENYARLRFYIDERLSDALAAVKDTKQQIEFSEADKAKVLASIQAKLESDALQTYVAGIRELVAARVKEDTLEQLFEHVIRRLEREVQDLAKRGNLNLTLGIFTTLIGLLVLGYSVFYSPITQSPQELLAYFIPRISLVVLIEIFAYFFLRLYKQSLTEIKYFQNEITNIESRQLALHITMRSDDAALRGKVVEELSRTERNFILGKDQTTVDLERERLARSTYSDVANAIKDILKKKSDG